MDLTNNITTGNINIKFATLIRINDILEDIRQDWKLNEIIQLKIDMTLLYKEVFPILNPTEKKEGANIWADINEIEIEFIEPEKYTYDNHLITLLHEFDFWIREKLKPILFDGVINHE